MAAVLTDFKNGFTASGYGSSATIGPVTILGGKYAFMCVDTGTADATLQMLGPDGTTYIAIHAAFTATTFTTFDLPAGVVEVTTGTGTSLSASLIPIPYRPAV